MLIDLHSHTTASDGHCSPGELVELAAAAGVTVLSVTDHDTVAGLADAASACQQRGIDFIPGIEITALRDGRDVHLLGYFIDPAWGALLDFLTVQRERRVTRVRAIAARLAELGMPIDIEAMLAPTLEHAGLSIGRPKVAAALVSAGYAADRRQAFDLWLAQGRPAFIPRDGAATAEVISIIRGAGGISSLAHPGLMQRDALIPELVSEGLGAVEAYHTDHAPDMRDHYIAVARGLNLAISGGSDFHGDSSHRGMLGSTPLPESEFRRLRATRRATASGSSTSS